MIAKSLRIWVGSSQATAADFWEAQRNVSEVVPVVSLCMDMEWIHKDEQSFFIFRNTPHYNFPSLQQISIIRTHIPFLRFFKFGQPEIRARLVAIPVLHQHTSSISAASRRAQTREANADAIALFVMRCVFGQESVRGDDSANVAEADLPSGAHCSTVVTAKVEIEPADNYRKGRVGAHCDKKQRCVLEMRPRVHGQ